MIMETEEHPVAHAARVADPAVVVLQVLLLSDSAHGKLVAQDNLAIHEGELGVIVGMSPAVAAVRIREVQPLPHTLKGLEHVARAR